MRSGRAAFERGERHPQVLADAALPSSVRGGPLPPAGAPGRGEERTRRLGERRGSGEQLARGVEDRTRADVGGQLVHVVESHRGRQGRRHRRRAEYGPVPLDRIAWLTTVGICLITSLILLISGYLGYAGVLLAIALSAAINLR